MLQVFSVNFYAFLDPGATLSFLTPLVAKKFDVLPDVPIGPFSVCTPMGYSVFAKRVYRKCHVSLFHKLTYVNLVEHDIFDIDVNLRIDLVNCCYSYVDFLARVFTCPFPKKPILE